MANTKIYTVVKDGEELEKLKTLTAAKKLADAEGAEVYSDGKCVYQGTVSPAEEKVKEKVEEQMQEQAKEPVKEIVTAEPVISEKPKQPVTAEPVTEKYRLKSLMNVRRKPSTDSTIIGTRPEGTIVRVLALEGDWLHLASDGYILYGHGRWADKVV